MYETTPESLAHLAQDIDEPTLRQYLLDWVRENSILDEQDSPLEIEVDTDLVEKSILDSVAFLELITSLEEKTGQSIDVTSMDPNDTLSINGLLRLVKKLKR